MNISEILEPGRVLGNVEARSKKRALEILSELLGHAGEECVANDIFENLVQREKLGCTALGRGVAVPHGRSPGLSGPAAAFVKLHEPVDFDAADGDLLVGLCAAPAPCGVFAREVLGDDRVVVQPGLLDAIDHAIGLVDDPESPGGTGVVVTGSVITAGQARALMAGS